MTMEGSTRRFELGLPLFKGLDMGALMGAQSRLHAGDPKGITEFVITLGEAGEARTLRKLAAIWTASDDDLQKAEQDAAFRVQLEEAAAQKPFPESVKATFDFFAGLMASLGASLASSEPEGESAPNNLATSPAASPSAGS
jgi:hypothetical protein